MRDIFHNVKHLIQIQNFRTRQNYSPHRQVSNQKSKKTKKVKKKFVGTNEKRKNPPKSRLAECKSSVSRWPLNAQKECKREI